MVRSKPLKVNESPITSEALRDYLDGQIIGREIYTFEKIGSTNSFAKRLATNGAPEGTLVVADVQSRGRGRLQRRWHAPAGKALCLSVILRPIALPEHLGVLSLMTAVSVATVIETYGLDVDLKWPNDVLVGSKKICGILVESEIAQDRPVFAVLGVGFNVNQQASDFSGRLREEATSLRIETRRSVERVVLLAQLLMALEERYLEFQNGNRTRILECWAKRCRQIGSNIKAYEGERACQGRFEGVDDSGRMILLTKEGRTTIHSAEFGQTMV